MITNIASIRSKYDELNIFTEELLDYDFKFDVICIQESWLGETDDPLVYGIDGYMCISHLKTSSLKGGLMVFFKDDYSYKVLNFSEHSNIYGQLIEISGGTLAKKIF